MELKGFRSRTAPAPCQISLYSFLFISISASSFLVRPSVCSFQHSFICKIPYPYIHQGASIVVFQYHAFVRCTVHIPHSACKSSSLSHAPMHARVKSRPSPLRLCNPGTNTRLLNSTDQRHYIPYTDNLKPFKMQFTTLLFAAAALVGVNAVNLTNTGYEITVGKSFSIGWAGASGPVTLTLKNGAALDLKAVSTITCKSPMRLLY